MNTAVNADGIRMTSHFRERGRAGGRPADALIDLYAGRGIAASILLRGTSVNLAKNLPLTAIAVDTRPVIETVLDRVLELASPGLVTLEQAVLLSDEIDPVGIASHLGEATKLCFFLGSHDRVYGAPAFEAACGLLHRRDIGGATVLPGVDGIAHGRRQHRRFLSRSAEVPLMITAVDCGDRIGLVLPELGSLLRRPLITLEQVRCASATGSSSAAGQRRGDRRPRLPAVAEAHRLHRRRRQARGAANSPRDRARAAFGRDQRGHVPPRDPGLPR